MPLLHTYFIVLIFYVNADYKLWNKLWKNLTRAKFKLNILSNFILKPWNLKGNWKLCGKYAALEQCQTNNFANNSSAVDAILKIKYEKKNRATKLPSPFPTGILKLKSF